MQRPTGSSTTCCRSCSTRMHSAARRRFATRSRAWRPGCALRRPIAAGSDVLLPGEIERRTRVQRERDGVPLDAATRHQIAAAVRPFAFQMPKGFAAWTIRSGKSCRAGGTPMGVMAFDFFTPGLAPMLAQAGAEFVLLDMEHSGAGIDTIKTQCAWRAAPASCRWCAFRRACITSSRRCWTPARWASWCRWWRRGSRRRSWSTHAAIGRWDGAASRSAWRMTATAAALRGRRWTPRTMRSMTIALIESGRGIENAEAILATPGLDLALARPLRFVRQPRHAWKRSTIRATSRRSSGCSTRSNAAGKPLGWLVGTGEAARAAVARGYPLHLHRPRGDGVSQRVGAGVRRRAERVTGPHLGTPGSRHKTTGGESMNRRDLIGAAMTGAAGLAAAAAVVPISACADATAGDRRRRDARPHHQGQEDPRHGGGHVAAVRHPRPQQPAGRLGDRDRRQLAKDLGVELELVQVTAPQRIPALLAGRADVAISSLSITLRSREDGDVRARRTARCRSSSPVPKKTQIKSAADMAGKKHRPDPRDARGSDGARHRAAGRADRATSTTSPRRCRR